MSEEFFEQLQQKIAAGWNYFIDWIQQNPMTIGAWYSQIIRFVMPVLALLILISVLRDMIRVKNPNEVWGYLNAGNFGRFAINAWECTIGRAKHCDIRVQFPAISRTQCALIRDNKDTERWQVHELSNSNPTYCEGNLVDEETYIVPGQKLKIGGVEAVLESVSPEEQFAMQEARLKSSRSKPPWFSFGVLTVFQLLTTIQLCINLPEYILQICCCYAGLCGIMWGYILISFSADKTGFEPEILAFFACTLNLAVTASSQPEYMFKGTVAIMLGVAFFLILGWYLRDLTRVVKARYVAAGFTVILLASNLVFGKVVYGAKNWINIFGMSLQPSEIAKIFFIFAGAATLERLFVKRNLGGFMLLSAYCLGALAIMSDFGSALIFFVVFIVIAFLRSGDYATLSLIVFGAFAGGLLILKFKPYIAARFSVWGHAWENASTTGFQQVRTMSAAASGGLIGVGTGKGWLHNVAAADTDLVFGMICEEWGLIIALLSVFSIAALAIFVVRVTHSARSAFYTTAACAAASLLVFQSMLNVFGSLDMLPLTGVTLPFISRGGSSMISAWGLLAFVKAGDTRAGASFAVRNERVDEEDVENYRVIEDEKAFIQSRNADYASEFYDRGNGAAGEDSDINNDINYDINNGVDNVGPDYDDIDEFLASFDEEEAEPPKKPKKMLFDGRRRTVEIEPEEIKNEGYRQQKRQEVVQEDFHEFDELMDMNKEGRNEEINGFLARFGGPGKNVSSKAKKGGKGR